MSQMRVDHMTGKIIKGIAGFYYVHTGQNGLYECKARGAFRNKKVKPLVGDEVRLDVIDEAERKGNITEILPRRNELVRPAVANIDQAFILFALREPDPNLNLLDRFLVQMAKSHIPVIIGFNKADLAKEADVDQVRKIYDLAGYRNFVFSVEKKEGLEQVDGCLAGKTTVLAGPSGVGKSSLMNHLLPEAGMETGAVSEKIKRGRHTTRHSELFYLGDETFLFDTPGFTSLYLTGFTDEELKHYFLEFAAYEPDCRFIGCNHINEPDCGVKQALEEGKISQVRYEHYVQMYNELKEQRRY